MYLGRDEGVAAKKLRLYMGRWHLFEDGSDDNKAEHTAAIEGTKWYYLFASISIWLLLMLSGAFAGIFVCPFGGCGYKDADLAFLCWNYETEAACLGELLPRPWYAKFTKGNDDNWPCSWNENTKLGYRPCEQSTDPRFHHEETMHSNQYAVIFELHCLVYWIAALWASDTFLTANELAQGVKDGVSSDENSVTEANDVEYGRTQTSSSSRKYAPLVDDREAVEA